MTLSTRSKCMFIVAAVVCATIFCLQFYSTEIYYFVLQNGILCSRTYNRLQYTADLSGTPAGKAFSSDKKWARSTAMNSTTKYILWLPNTTDNHAPTNRPFFISSGCRVNLCHLTQNETLVPYNEFAAVVIHQPLQTSPYIINDRRAHQMFVMYNLDPPDGSNPYRLPFPDYYNWTMTYRADSDIPIKYGDILPMESAPETHEEAAVMRREFIQLAGVNPARGKTRVAAWMPVWKCNEQSKSQDYVKILRNYIDVDVLSRNANCGRQDECFQKGSTPCQDVIDDNYKFYLAFETSNCRDFATETFFLTMSRNIVPVVLGGANYSVIAPPHSYINALDYTPRQLAAYLSELNRNDTLYSEYFWWKPHYRIRIDWSVRNEAFCDLCEALHTRSTDGSSKTKTRDVPKWYTEEAHCQSDSKFRED